MFHNSLCWKRLTFLCAYLGASLTILLAAMPLSTAYAQAGDHAIFQVKVLLITMFPPERDAWLKKPGTTWMQVSPPFGPTGDQDGAVYCMVSNGSCNGIYLTMTGTEKVNAASSMIAVLNNPNFSFKGAYFLTTGTAATSPYSKGTLGFVALAHWVADRDQGTHVIPTFGYPFGYKPPTIFPDETAKFQLNADLVNQAYALTHDLELTDKSDENSPRTNAQERALYPGQAGRKPYVAMCDTITTDSFIVGSKLSRQTKYITKTVTDTPMPGRYCTMENEDTGVAGALNRASNSQGTPQYLQCYLNLRAASAFDQPPPGQSVKRFINEHFRANNAALANLLTVGSTLISELLLQKPCAYD
jgi:purine nucleoside permease